MKTFLLRMTIGSALALAVACASGTDSGSDIPTTSEEIGTEGGTVEAGPASVEIPEDALGDTEEITLKEVSPDADLPKGLKLAGPAIAFTPHGLSFDEDVKLTLPYDSSSKYLVILRLDDEDDESWEEIEDGDFEDGEATLQVKSFSVYAVAEADDDAGAGGAGSEDDAGDSKSANTDSNEDGDANTDDKDADKDADTKDASGDTSVSNICALNCSARIKTGCDNDPSEDECLEECATSMGELAEACRPAALTFVECLDANEFLICDEDGEAGFPDDAGDPDDPNDCGSEAISFNECTMNQ